jgi:LPS-assembly lipoprotein
MAGPGRPHGRRALLVMLGPALGSALVPAFGAAGLAGCGFALRETPRLPFSTIALTGFAARSPLADELRRRLGAQARVVEAPAQAQVVLHALEDRREKSVVASTAAAQVREFQLRVRLEFRVHTAAGRELVPRAELLAKRDMSYSETAALAKEQEEADLYREMQGDVVAQVLRRLASLQV